MEEGTLLKKAITSFCLLLTFLFCLSLYAQCMATQHREAVRRKRIRAIQKQRHELAHLYGDGLIAEDEYEQKLGELNNALRQKTD
ncbi:hypothetical protein AWB71_05318 [Caballeronia peredens]|nr:hypothetical protein AWB71_05318 [Caballeronia peredens]